MIIKILIILIMLFIAGSLFSGLVFLVKDTEDSRRMVKALTVRITISLILFILLIISFKLGWIKPHGI